MMKIFGCFLSVVLILILNHSLLLVRSTEVKPSTPVKDDKLKNVEDSESKVKGQSYTAEVYSSFNEEAAFEETLSSLPSAEEYSVFKNIDISPDLSETADGGVVDSALFFNSAVVFNSIDTPAELKNRAEHVVEDEIQNHTKNQLFSQSEEVYIVRAEPKTEAQPQIEELDEKESNESATVFKSSQEEISKTAPQHEDIPSFREWSQKQLAEAERKKVDHNSTVNEKSTKLSGKFRIKNYASPDCGAKIVSANPESVSSSSVLSSSKDEYMLNYCTNRIWFVVELCEAIEAKQLDLANFELYSSSPKEFTVSISHRFPTRDWSDVGKFTAKDSRDIQTFDLNPHLFGKYIKVELFSHYGKEQFCPVSWVAVFGTSEFEVLAKEDERHAQDDSDDEDEDLLIGQRRDAPKSFFTSATDAVMSIFKKATAPFRKTENNETQIHNKSEALILNKTQYCVTPRYIIVCDNCSQSFYDEVYDTLSCHMQTLADLIAIPIVKSSLINNESCAKYGLDFNSLRQGAPFPSNKVKKKEDSYFTSWFRDFFVGALCNVLAASENKVVVNTTNEIASLKNLTEKKLTCGDSQPQELVPSSSCGLECKKSSRSVPVTTSKITNSKSYFLTEILRPTVQFSEKIEPTKTLKEEEMKKLPSSDSVLVESSEMRSTIASPTVKIVHTATVPSSKDFVGSTEFLEIKEAKIHEKKEEVKDAGPQLDNQGSNVTTQDATFDSILKDINEFEEAVHSNPSSSLPRVNNLPTESIFLRLANRIKNLEINMSLSSTYLEELSRRYRNQLEMLSKTINSTVKKIEERYRIEEERERLREKEILLLRLQLANLTRDVSSLLKEKNSWRPKASSISQHIVLVSVEIAFVWIIFSCWKRTKDPPKNGQAQVRKKVRRRKSLEGVTGHNVPLRKKRRPSDEALEIAVSRNHKISSLKLEKKRKRKKKDSKCSVNMIQVKRKKSDSHGSSEEIARMEVVPPADAACIAASMQVVETTNRFAAISSPLLKTNNKENEVEKFTAPVFMKTALASRNSRIRVHPPEKETSLSVPYSKPEPEEPSAKEKKSSGASLKKYVKKFFDKRE